MSKTRLAIGDADALIALAHLNDGNHERAQGILDSLAKANFLLRYPATAFAEATTAAQRKMSDVKLADKLIALLDDGMIDLVAVTPKIVEQASLFWKQSHSKQDTFFDAIVCAMAKEHQATAIFSFDQFYKKQGFTLAGEL